MFHFTAAAMKPRILIPVIFSLIVSILGAPYNYKDLQKWDETPEQLKDEQIKGGITPYDASQEKNPINNPYSGSSTSIKFPHTDEGKKSDYENNKYGIDKKAFGDGKIDIRRDPSKVPGYDGVGISTNIEQDSKGYDLGVKPSYKPGEGRNVYVKEEKKVEGTLDIKPADESLIGGGSHDADKKIDGTFGYKPADKPLIGGGSYDTDKKIDGTLDYKPADKPLIGGGSYDADKNIDGTLDYKPVDKPISGGGSYDADKKIDSSLDFKPTDKPVLGDGSYDAGKDIDGTLDYKPADKPISGGGSYDADKKIDGKLDYKPADKPISGGGSYDADKKIDKSLDYKPTDKPVLGDGSYDAGKDIDGTLDYKPADKPVLGGGSYDADKKIDGKVDFGKPDIGSGKEEGYGFQDSDNSLGFGLDVKPLESDKPVGKDDPYHKTKLPDQSVYGKEDKGGKTDERHWAKKVGDKWNTFKDNVGRAFNSKVDTFRNTVDEVAKNAGATFHSVSTSFHQTIPEIWLKFEGFLTNFGKKMHRGADYAVRKITVSFDEVKASKLITKLQKRLEEGDEIVDKLFEKIGEKVSSWKEKNPQINIDEGLVYKEGEQMSQHYPNLPDLFQDKEIKQQVEKMVDKGIIEREDMSVLCCGQKHVEPPTGVLKDVTY